MLSILLCKSQQQLDIIVNKKKLPSYVKYVKIILLKLLIWSSNLFRRPKPPKNYKEEIIMSAFSTIWDNEVKALAQACVTDPKLVRLMMQSEGYKPTAEEEAYLNEVSGKYHDPYGMFYISDLIWRVEHALADGRECQANIALLNVYSALASSDYLPNVFKGDDTSEEWKSRVALRDGLKKLIKCN
jgi:hypothetical protein